MQELLEAMARRRSVVREIVDACVAMGEPIDLDTVAQVMNEMTAITMGGPDPQPLDEQDTKLICALGTVLSALRGLTCTLAEGQKPGRRQRLLRELPGRIQRQVEDALEPHLALMPKEQGMKVMVESTLWAFVIWSPAEQKAMFQIMERAAMGSRMLKEQRERAAEFLERYRRCMPMGNAPRRE